MAYSFIWWLICVLLNKNLLITFCRCRIATMIKEGQGDRCHILILSVHVCLIRKLWRRTTRRGRWRRRSREPSWRKRRQSARSRSASRRRSSWLTWTKVCHLSLCHQGDGDGVRQVGVGWKHDCRGEFLWHLVSAGFELGVVRKEAGRSLFLEATQSWSSKKKDVNCKISVFRAWLWKEGKRDALLIKYPPWFWCHH